MNELNDLGIFDAATSMLRAKEDIAKIALGQVSREPVTNLINTMMAAGGALTKADPEFTAKLAFLGQRQSFFLNKDLFQSIQPNARKSKQQTMRRLSS